MTRVLVVDDEIDTLNLLRTILEISGYQAFTTLNSVEAIMLAEMEHPDCILLDIMMPQLDGFTLCKMMRLHPATRNLPIIFVTAYSALDIEERRLEAGADMVLPKPIGMDTLIEVVEKAAELRASRAEETKPVPEFLTTKSISVPPSVTAAAPQNGQPVPNAESKTVSEVELKSEAKPEGTPAVKPPEAAPVLASANAVQDKPDNQPKLAAAPTPIPAPVAAKVEAIAESTKTVLKTVVQPMDDQPIDIGISPDPVEEIAKEAPAASVPPAKEMT